MPITHLVSLLVHSAALVPSRIGSNWGGLVFTLVLFGATEFALWLWGDMKGRWGRSALLGLGVVIVAWTGLFALSFVLTIYDDHQNLVGAAARIKRDTGKQRDALHAQLESVRSNTRQQIENLTTSCAVKEGVNQTLQKQNRDEQVLIAGCQNQALKLLVPEALKITPIVFDNVEDNTAMRTIRWLLLSNREIAPHLNIVCGEGMTYMRAASLRIVGGAGAFFGGVSGRLGPTAWELSQGSGTWGPSNPLLITLTYQGSADAVCSFTPR